MYKNGTKVWVEFPCDRPEGPIKEVGIIEPGQAWLDSNNSVRVRMLKTLKIVTVSKGQVSRYQKWRTLDDV
jgi:hypothetical protein